MSNPIQDNAKALLALLTDQKTVDTYKNFFLLTWKILKETANFLWLLILFVIVAIGWTIDNVSSLSDNFMAWRQTVDQKPEGNVATEVGTRFWETSKKSAVSALTAARKQLNIEEPPPKAPKTKAVGSAPSTSAQPSAPTATAPTATASTATAPTATASTVSQTAPGDSGVKNLADYKQPASTAPVSDSSETSEE